MKLHNLYEEVLKESESITLKSKSDKGNRYFKMLKSAQWQHYDAPKGNLTDYVRGEEDRKRLVTNLSKADKKLYRQWLKTPEGEESIKLFADKQTQFKDRTKHLGESIIIDKYGDELMVDENWFGLNIPISKYKTHVKDSLVNIITKERGISEKSFKEYDKIIEVVGEFFKNNPTQGDLISEHELKSSRPEYVAEIIYNQFNF